MRHKKASSTLSSRNVSADSSTITLNLLPMPMIKGKGPGDFLNKVRCVSPRIRQLSSTSLFSCFRLRKFPSQLLIRIKTPSTSPCTNTWMSDSRLILPFMGPRGKRNLKKTMLAKYIECKFQLTFFNSFCAI